MKILVVEDDPTVGQYVQRGLNEHQYHADLVGDGLEGLRLHVEQPRGGAEQHEQQENECHCQAKHRVFPRFWAPRPVQRRSFSGN